MSLMDFGARLIPLQKGGKRPARKFANHDFTKAEINNFIRHGYNVGLLAQPKFIFKTIKLTVLPTLLIGVTIMESILNHYWKKH